jgi:hypothetical protein
MVPRVLFYAASALISPYAAWILRTRQDPNVVAPEALTATFIVGLIVGVASTGLIVYLHSMD